MSEHQITGPIWVLLWLLVGLVIGLLFILMKKLNARYDDDVEHDADWLEEQRQNRAVENDVQREARHLHVLNGDARGNCGNCAHFDLEEGQAIIKAHPIFLEAASHVSPNLMMRKLDEEGNPLPNPHRLKEKENSWGLFGACEKREQLRHTSDKCEFWTAFTTVEHEPHEQESAE